MRSSKNGGVANMFCVSCIILTVLFSSFSSFSMGLPFLAGPPFSGRWVPFRSIRFDPVALRYNQQVVSNITAPKEQLIERLGDIHRTMLSDFGMSWLRVYPVEKKRIDLALSQTALPQDRREWIYPKEAYEIMEILHHRESHIICLDDKWRLLASLYAWNFPYHLFVPALENFQKGCVLGSRVANEYTPIINLGIELCEKRFGGATAVKLGHPPDEWMLACKTYHELLSDLRALEDSEKRAMEASMQQEGEL
jgi:hypothetical protein